MRYRIACFVLALLGTLSPAFAFDEGHVSKLYALNECVGCDPGIADLQNLDPSYANFTGATFQGADLGYYGPRRTELSYANWAGAVLRNANLAAAVLSAAKLTDEGIRSAILQGVLLRNGNVVGAVLSTSKLTDADIRGAVLQGVLLRNANLMGTVVSGVNLTDAYIRGAALKNLEHQYDFLQHQD